MRALEQHAPDLMPTIAVDSAQLDCVSALVNGRRQRTVLRHGFSVLESLGVVQSCNDGSRRQDTDAWNCLKQLCLCVFDIRNSLVELVFRSSKRFDARVKGSQDELQRLTQSRLLQPLLPICPGKELLAQANTFLFQVTAQRVHHAHPLPHQLSSGADQLTQLPHLSLH